MMNRRQLLTGLGATAIAVVGIGIGTAAAGAGGTADALSPTDPISFSYRGHRILVAVSKDMAMATVDGKKMVHIERSDRNLFHSHLLPFQEYSDPRTLVRDLLDIEAAHLVML